MGKPVAFEADETILSVARRHEQFIPTLCELADAGPGDAAVIFAFYRYPYHGLLMAFALKPVVDFFWLAKKHDLVSPLYIAGIAAVTVASSVSL